VLVKVIGLSRCLASKVLMMQGECMVIPECTAAECGSCIALCAKQFSGKQNILVFKDS
jgi:hypothetical protein